MGPSRPKAEYRISGEWTIAVKSKNGMMFLNQIEKLRERTLPT